MDSDKNKIKKEDEQNRRAFQILNDAKVQWVWDGQK
jgi:hypothetical protein